MKSEKISDKQPESLGNSLFRLLDTRKISAADLARALNLPYNTINRLLNGITTDPKLSTLQLIAEYFDVSISSLTGDSNNDPSVVSNTTRTLPIVDWDKIHSSNPLSSLNLKNWPHWRLIPLESMQNLSQKAYGLKSKRSLSPRFPETAIFIIDPTETPRDNDMVLVKLRAQNEVTMRELSIDPPTWTLFSVTASSPPLYFNKKEHQIIGTVVFTIIDARAT